MQQYWFTSDEHHGHRNVMTGWEGQQGSSTPRPWSTLEDMTEGLIDRHNAVVKRGDLVFHLGDTFWRTFGVENSINTMKRLNGQHFYILGNHEEVFEKDALGTLRSQFVWVKERATIHPRKDMPSIVLDHFAGRVWNKSHSGSYQLYGHSHGALEGQGRQMDVGVDANNFYPVSLDEVIARIGSIPITNKFTPRT